MTTFNLIKKQHKITEISGNNKEKITGKKNIHALEALLIYSGKFPENNFLTQDLYSDKKSLDNFILKEKKNGYCLRKKIERSSDAITHINIKLKSAENKDLIYFIKEVKILFGN